MNGIADATKMKYGRNKMIAILKYTDCLRDGNKVFGILSTCNIEILKTRQGDSIYPEVTIRIKDNNELCSLLYTLNKYCDYEVRVIKTKSENNFLHKIKNIFIYSK